MADRPEQLLSAGVSRHSREVFWTRIWSKLLPCLFAVLASETDEEKHDSFEMFADREVGITNTGNTEKFFRFLIASLLLFVSSRNSQSASLASFLRAASHMARQKQSS